MIEFKEYTDELLGESIFCGKHPSGLEIRVTPKKGYKSSYAVFAVKYGSIDTALPDGKGSWKSIPEGTAHFLEHKLFESEDLDAFERFAKTGASANAFTSFEQTAYLFKGSDDIYKSLEILLDFVQSPYFTKETIEKEQGIIGQEISMYNDIPDWAVMFNLLKALYKHHPVRIDIAGTQSSIAQIDDKLLYSLYETFYNPSNMILSIAGGVNPKEVFEFIEDKIKYEKKEVPERRFIKETSLPVQKEIKQALSVNRSQYLLGFKEELDKPDISLKTEMASEMLLEILCGKSSNLYKKLLESGFGDNSFGSEYFSGYGYSAFLMGSPSNSPEKAIELIKEEIDKLKNNGISTEKFDTVKKKMYGRLVMGYNDIDDIANEQVSLYFSGDEPFSELKTCKQITIEDVEQRLNVLDENSSAVSIIVPKE
ncbi:MAG: insulinase family protein [Clostridiales bacterium]|nr:insulinase family protein [Clostridiales bacterium]